MICRSTQALSAQWIQIDGRRFPLDLLESANENALKTLANESL
jgi:hypothetical protein